MSQCLSKFFLTAGFLASIVAACSFYQEKSLFLSSSFVDLKGKESLTIIRNMTSDTLTLRGSFFNDLPYIENSFSLKLAPNQKDTLKFTFTYPDFIFVDSPHYFRLFNQPGHVLECDVLELKPKSARMEFRGETADINKYYLAYHNTMGAEFENNRPYFQVGDRINDFNKFPAKADSLTKLSTDFLNRYSSPLPDWFKKHEEWRLKYLSGFLKDNVLMSKEFYGGKKIPVRSDYFAYESLLPLENHEMIFNNQFLWYTRAVVGRRARTAAKKPDDISTAIAGFSLTDSLFKNIAAGDLVRMDRLASLFTRGHELLYDSLLTHMRFDDARRKQILDSRLRVAYGVPAVGKKAPRIDLTDLNGKKVSLEDLKAKKIIINFWAVWCGPCIVEFPHENKIHQEGKDKGLVVVNICVDSDIAAWKSVSTKKNLQTINLFTEKGEYRFLAKRFGIYGLPKSILLDGDLSVIDNNFKRASSLTSVDIKKLVQ